MASVITIKRGQTGKSWGWWLQLRCHACSTGTPALQGGRWRWWPSSRPVMVFVDTRNDIAVKNRYHIENRNGIENTEKSLKHLNKNGGKGANNMGKRERTAITWSNTERKHLPPTWALHSRSATAAALVMAYPSKSHLLAPSLHLLGGERI